MQEHLHFQWFRLRQPLAQRRLYDFTVNCLLNVAWTSDIANCEPLFDKRPTKHVINALVSLKVQCCCKRGVQSLTHLFSTELFQDLQLVRLEQGDEHRMAHPSTLAPSRVSLPIRASFREGIPWA